MTEKTMSIRQMCDSFDVTPRTLRFYESKGLISPMREGQRRLYSRRDHARLTLILRSKRFGFSLEEIHELLDMYAMDDCGTQQLERTLVLARQRLAAMEAQQAELAEAIAGLRIEIARGEARSAGRERNLLS